MAFPWVETSTGPGGFMICKMISSRNGEITVRHSNGIRLFPVRLWTCRAFITELRIEHSLHVQFCTFPMWSKSGSSTVPALYP